MNFFNQILEKRQLEKCRLPLWKLKLTDEEYEELRSILEKRTHIVSSEPFLNYRRECTLFFAEYWRREFVKKPGGHSKQMVYDALNSTRKSVNQSEDFYYQATKGAKCLGIELYEGHKQDVLNSMLYQGGLPMKLLTSNIANSIWDRFTRGLVNRHVNFEELNLGVVASRNQSIRDYCDQMILGIESGNYQLMPFYCSDEYEKWFVYLKDLAKQERKRERQLHPFTLDWEFKVDNLERIIYSKFIVKGGQKLPEVFLEKEGLKGNSFFSVQIRVNDRVTDTFDYIKNFCRYAVISKHAYHCEDNISIIIDNKNESHINGELDMTVPHILFCNTNKKYELGNKMGKVDSLLMIPEGWKVLNREEYNILDYTWENVLIKCIQIPQGYQKNIIVEGADGTITFGSNAKMYWTELTSYPLYQPNVKQPLYNAGDCKFVLCYDTEDEIKTVRNPQIQYRNKYSNEWSSTPSYGEIFARAIDPAGHFVTPTRFINVGTGLTISLVNADSESCSIRIVWVHGRVTSSVGIRNASDTWDFKKSNCPDRNQITFTLIPNENSDNSFNVSVKSPFKEFYIMDSDRNIVNNNSWIPYSDLDKYQYHIVGHNIKEYTFGDSRRQIKWIDDKLYILDNGSSRHIPYEGSLLTLFGKREEVRALLERTSKNMLNATIPVNLVISNQQSFSFEIKDSPFRPIQIENRVFITAKDKSIIDFRGTLKLLKLDEPTLKSISMYYDEKEGYVLPEEIKTWGNTLLIGRSRGRICPALVKLSTPIDNEYRVNNRETTIETICKNLKDSTLGDELWQRIIGWFNRVQHENIPASSLLELSCVAKDPKYLMYLAFQLFAQCADKDEHELLTQQLLQMSDDLGFQWYWLSPLIDQSLHIINGFVRETNNSVVRNIYVQWCSTKGENMLQYLNALGDKEQFENNSSICLMEYISSFKEWLKDLSVLSILDSYDSNVDELIQTIAETIIKSPRELIKAEMKTYSYVEANQDYINDETNQFFNKYNESGKFGNEQWLYKRVNALVANIKEGSNLFEESEEIRRSITFCCKSSNNNFVLALNNKLIRS